jgi:hypothetical protein
MPNAYGRAFTTANFLSNLAALKAINFGASDPSGVWFLVKNLTGNSDIWLWEPTSTAATNETSVVRPDSIAPGSPGRCVKSLVDANSLGGILAAIALLNTAGLIERATDGSAAIVGLGAFARTFLGSASDSAARTTLNLGNVTNTSDTNKPVSTAQQTALNLKANLASPGFTGIPTVPTAAAGTNTQQAANTAFVTTAITNLVNSSPVVLDTLSELATALGNDANFSTTITNLIGTKLSITSNLSDLNNRQTALNNLAGAVTANRFLKGNGTNVVFGQVDLATADITGILPLANGTNFVPITGNKTIAGITTFLDTTAATSTTAAGTVFLGGVGIVGGIKTPNAWLLEPRSGGVAQDLNAQAYPQFAGTRWFDGSVINTNAPVNAGMLLQFDPLFGIAAVENKYRVQEFIASNRWFKRMESNAIWGIWYEMAFLNKAQTFTATQNFTSQININNIKILGPRETDWTTPTGTPNKGAFSADTATLIQTAQRLLAVEQMLRTHGLIN